MVVYPHADTDPASSMNHDMMPDHAALADHRAFFDHGKSADFRVPPDHRVWVYRVVHFVRPRL
jgi:hypothetical protein